MGDRVKIYLDGGTSIDFDLAKDETLEGLAKLFGQHPFVVIGTKAIVPTKKILYATTIIEDD